MNEYMKKKLSTQTSKEEGNRSLLSKPPRRTYNIKLSHSHRRMLKRSILTRKLQCSLRYVFRIRHQSTSKCLLKS